MLVHVSDGVAVAISSVVWLVTSLVVGAAFARRPAERIRSGPLTRLRRWEASGRWWERHLAVRRWKDALPEAGALFGGVSKRRVPSRGTADLARFRVETLRAEDVHWTLMATTPIHAVWCRPPIFAGMVVFALVANLPFIVVQRANRGRLERILARRAEREGRGAVRPA